MIGIFDTVQSLDHEFVMQGLRVSVTSFFGTDKDTEIEQGSDFHVIVLRAGLLVDCGKPVAKYLDIVRVHTVQFQGIGTKPGFRIYRSHFIEVLPIFGKASDKNIVLLYSGGLFIQLSFRISFITVIRLPFAFKDCQFLVQFCLFQQIIIA